MPEQNRDRFAQMFRQAGRQASVTSNLQELLAAREEAITQLEAEDGPEETPDLYRPPRRITPVCQICHSPTKRPLKYGRYGRVCKNCRENIPLCKNCRGQINDAGDCEQCNRRYINSYRFNLPVRPRVGEFERLDLRQELFGIELEFEVEDRFKIAKYLDENYSFAYAKHDGSMEHGVEVIFQPFTRKWLKENENKVINFFEDMKELDASISPQCGMHIHVNREVMSPLTVYKVVKLLKDNKREVLEFAGRHDPDWVRRYCDFDHEEDFEPVLKARRYYQHYPGPKYVAINTSRPDTVEFRFFSGTTEYKTFKKYLTFLQNLLDYTTSTSLRNLEWGSLI